MSIFANKYSEIYTALFSDIYSAERARLSNKASIICFGAKTITFKLAKILIEEWLDLKKNRAVLSKIRYH